MGGRRGRLISTEDRHRAIQLIKEARENGARKHKACEILGITLRTLERWEKPDGKEDRRKVAERRIANQLTAEEKEMILKVANSGEYCDLPPCKIVPMLADEGRYIASESSFYRVLKAHHQLTHRQLSRPARHQKPKAYIATGPNQVWSWDITYLPTQIRGFYFYLYMIVDIFSRKIVGWSIHEAESADHASALITQACLDESVNKDELVLHSDNGSPMKGAAMLTTLEILGVIPSFSRPSVSDDNPYSESLFKTLKYHPDFPMLDKFEAIDAARLWSEQFSQWYNYSHLHSGLKFVTPVNRHNGEDKKIFAYRKMIYQQAKQRHPERWSGATRNWSLPDEVTLNPNKKNKEANMQVNNDQEKIAA